MKILMAVDDSKLSEARLQAVIARGRSTEMEVMVLHMLQPPGPPPPQMDAGYAPELASEKKTAQVLVENIAGKLRDEGLKAQTRVEVGDARTGIVDCAEDWGADLIVVGSHGTSGIQRFLMGSVSEFVARQAKCSVEIVRARLS
ncbi:MAG TPA: universal stress protein [Acidobacteriaceae bacterium]|jgi:nucleotide-binding universal stress UspA family protein